KPLAAAPQENFLESFEGGCLGVGDLARAFEWKSGKRAGVWCGRQLARRVADERRHAPPFPLAAFPREFTLPGDTGRHGQPSLPLPSFAFAIRLAPKLGHESLVRAIEFINGSQIRRNRCDFYA